MDSHIFLWEKREVLFFFHDKLNYYRVGMKNSIIHFERFNLSSKGSAWTKGYTPHDFILTASPGSIFSKMKCGSH